MEELYLIEILHQTTTIALKSELLSRCILLKFYIKPQQAAGPAGPEGCCILLKFYIKPQQRRRFDGWRFGCILLKFYIKPQPLDRMLEWSEVVSY